MVRIRNEVEANAVGNSDLSREPDELLPKRQNPLEHKRMLLARVDGEIVARGTYETDADSLATWVSVEVLPAFRSDAASLPSPTGFGSVPRDSVATRFLLKHGNVLEQVGRMRGAAGASVDHVIKRGREHPHARGPRDGRLLRMGDHGCVDEGALAC